MLALEDVLHKITSMTPERTGLQDEDKLYRLGWHSIEHYRLMDDQIADFKLMKGFDRIAGEKLFPLLEEQ